MLAPPKTIFLIRQMFFELRVDFAKSEGYVVNQRDLDKKRLTAIEMCKTVKSSTFGIPLQKATMTPLVVSSNNPI
jgi:hypothetical protein